MAENTNPIDALLSMIQSQLLDVNTSLPATIVSYSNGRARVLPTPRKRYADGSTLEFPVIPDVRVCWPSFDGGSAGVKGPVKPGDKCLLVFSQQAIDGSDDRRMFDLQDAYAVMCDLGNAGQGDSGDNEHMTVFYGSAYLRFTKGGKLIINAPGGTEIKTPTIDATVSTSVLFTTPKTTITGTVTIGGLLTYTAGLSGSGGSGGTKISGNIEHTGGSIKSLGRTIDGTHKHTYGSGQVTDVPTT